MFVYMNREVFQEMHFSENYQSLLYPSGTEPGTFQENYVHVMTVDAMTVAAWLTMSSSAKLMTVCYSGACFPYRKYFNYLLHPMFINETKYAKVDNFIITRTDYCIFLIRYIYAHLNISTTIYILLLKAVGQR